MDLKIMYNVVVLYILKILITVAVANLNGTDTNQSATAVTSTATITTTTEGDRLIGNPFWLGFTIILFISIVIISVTISLTYGIYKFREEAKKRGHYKHKCQVYREPEHKAGPDYEIFITNTDSARGASTEESNVTYIGSA